MKIHDLAPGTPEWHEHRLNHWNASEAAAMLGLSPHMKRNELLRMKHTGNPQVFSEWFEKNILANGHAVEAEIRPHIEAKIGQELYPVIGSEGKLSVSFDGLTMDGKEAWECKQWNEAIAELVRSSCTVPDSHMPQIQQALMVSGADRLLFTVTDGTPERCESVWVEPDTEWFKRINQGWAQFADDLANYTPPADAPAAVAAPIEALPALVVRVEGKVLSTNLGPFRARAMAFIESIKTDLQTDQDFADAEGMTKFLADGEKQLEAAKAAALAQTASIDELFRTIDGIREEMRAKRLTLERTVKARKDTIRTEIEDGGKAALAAHVAKLNERLGRPCMPAIPADFAGAMRGKKTIASLRNAVDTELARAKIAASEIADTIEINLIALRDLAGDYKMLFADTAQLVLKDRDSVVAIIRQRIADHTAEQERKQREAEAAKAAQSATAAPAAVGQPPAAPIWPAQSGPVPAGMKAPAAPEPTDEDIIALLMRTYLAPRQKAIAWIMRIASAGNKPAAAEPKRRAAGGRRK
jgi:predicted phage-related endonuclease